MGSMTSEVALQARAWAARMTLAQIEPPEERERAERIYRTALSLLDWREHVRFVSIPVGLLTGFGVPIFCWTVLQGSGTLARLEQDVLETVVLCTCASYLVTPFLSIPVVRGIMWWIHLRGSITWLRAQLDDLCSKPGTPALLEKIGEADPRFREVIPDLLSEVRV